MAIRTAQEVVRQSLRLIVHCERFLILMAISLFILNRFDINDILSERTSIVVYACMPAYVGQVTTVIRRRSSRDARRQPTSISSRPRAPRLGSFYRCASTTPGEYSLGVFLHPRERDAREEDVNERIG